MSSCSGSGWSPANKRFLVYSGLKVMLPVIALLQKNSDNQIRIVTLVGLWLTGMVFLRKEVELWFQVGHKNSSVTYCPISISVFKYPWNENKIYNITFKWQIANIFVMKYPIRYVLMQMQCKLWRVPYTLPIFHKLMPTILSKILSKTFIFTNPQ